MINNPDIRTSCNSLAVGPNLNAIIDGNFRRNSNEQNDFNLDEDPNVLERVQIDDGTVQNIRVYQVYLLGMSGTGKCSLLRQFKTTEYRGIYDYSASVGESIFTFKTKNTFSSDRFC